MVFGLLCVLLVALPIGLLVGAVILRAAVSLANKVVGGSPDQEAEDDYDWDSDEDDPPTRRTRPGGAVPVPGLGRAVLIVFAAGLANVLVGIVVGLAFGAARAAGGGFNGPGPRLAAQLVSLPFGFLVSACIGGAMLPTTFPRACLVTLFQYLIGLVIVAVVGGVLFAAGFALFGLRA